MKTALFVLMLMTTNLALAQANCYPQLVATPQGVVTVIVCPDGSVTR